MENKTTSRKTIIEVKSATLVKKRTAKFPDAPTTRGTRHVEELITALADDYDGEIVFITKRKDAEKSRIKSYRKTIKFSDRGKIYQGLIKDISPSGVFLASQDTFAIGQILSFALPQKNGPEAKIEGQIIWADETGLGVIFLNK